MSSNSSTLILRDIYARVIIHLSPFSFQFLNYEQRQNVTASSEGADGRGGVAYFDGPCSHILSNWTVDSATAPDGAGDRAFFSLTTRPLDVSFPQCPNHSARDRAADDGADLGQRVCAVHRDGDVHRGPADRDEAHHQRRYAHRDRDEDNHTQLAQDGHRRSAGRCGSWARARSMSRAAR